MCWVQNRSLDHAGISHQLVADDIQKNTNQYAFTDAHKQTIFSQSKRPQVECLHFLKRPLE
jgi:hypothetical protein